MCGLHLHNIHLPILTTTLTLQKVTFNHFKMFSHVVKVPENSSKCLGLQENSCPKIEGDMSNVPPSGNIYYLIPKVNNYYEL
jgi:hypothetical protein